MILKKIFKTVIRRKNIALILSITMAASVILTGCGKSKDSEDETKVISYSNDTITATLGEKNILLDEAKFYAYSQQASYEVYYLANNQTIDWTTKYKDDETLQDAVKDEAMSLIKKRIIFNNHASDYGIELSDDDKSTIEKQVKDFFDNSDEKIIKATEITKELLTRLYTENYIYNKVRDKLLEGKDVTVTDEEAKQTNITALQIYSDSTDDPEATAKTILKRVQDGEKLDEVSKKYGFNVSVGNVGLGDMDGNNLEKVCLELKTGEVAMVKIDGTHYIVYCNSDYDEEATKIAKDNKKTEKENAIIDEVYSGWEKDVEFNIKDDVWDTIKYDTAIFTTDNMESVTTSADETTAEGETTAVEN